MTIIVGIIIVALISWMVAVFGMAIFHTYERYSWIPQVIVLLILIGEASPHIDTSLQSTGSSAEINAYRLSFSLCLSVPLSWAGAGSDFYVYYTESTNKRLTFFMTLTGLTLSFVFVTLVGVSLASGVANTLAWSDAFAISSGALIVEGFAPLGGFGKFCGVVVALGVISNNVPGTVIVYKYGTVNLISDRYVCSSPRLSSTRSVWKGHSPLPLGMCRRHDLLCLRYCRPQPPFRHFPELPSAYGLLAYDFRLDCPRGTSYLQKKHRFRLDEVGRSEVSALGICCASCVLDWVGGCDYWDGPGLVRRPGGKACRCWYWW